MMTFTFDAAVRVAYTYNAAIANGNNTDVATINDALNTATLDTAVNNNDIVTNFAITLNFILVVRIHFDQKCFYSIFKTRIVTAMNLRKREIDKIKKVFQF